MRSDTAFFSAADISRRFLCGLTSGLALCGGGGRFSRRGAPRRGARRPGGEAPKELLHVGQRLDLRLEAVDFALSVGVGLSGWPGLALPDGAAPASGFCSRR